MKSVSARYYAEIANNKNVEYYRFRPFRAMVLQSVLLGLRSTF